MGILTFYAFWNSRDDWNRVKSKTLQYENHEIQFILFFWGGGGGRKSVTIDNDEPWILLI